MKIKVSTPPQTQRRAFLNLLQVSQRTTGALIAKKWPRKRGTPKTAAAQQAVKDFTDACIMMKDQDPAEQAVAQEMTAGRVYMARDIQMASMYGVLTVISFKNGAVAVGGRTLSASVQAMLNEIDDRPGAMLVRGAGGWQSVQAGTLNYVLSSAGPGNVPYWQDITGALPTIDALLDTITDAPGTMLYRSGSAWSQIPAGSDGEVLTFDGTGTIPAWATLTVPPQYTFDDRFSVTGTDVALAAIPSGHVLANVGTATAEAADASFGALLNVNLGTIGNRLLLNDGTSWTPGTIGAGLHVTGDTIDLTTPPGAAVGVLSVQTGSNGNGNDTTEDTLKSYTLPAGTLSANGMTVRIHASGTFASNAHSKALRAYFGATVVNSFTSVTFGSAWDMRVEITRTSSGNQYRDAVTLIETGVSSVEMSIGNASLTTTDTADIIIKITGQTGTAAANDVTCTKMLVELLP